MCGNAPSFAEIQGKEGARRPAAPCVAQIGRIRVCNVSSVPTIILNRWAILWLKAKKKNIICKRATNVTVISKRLPRLIQRL